MAPKGHISLSELQGMVSRALGDAFPVPLWIAAEIAEMKVNASGHCYLELVEKGNTNSVPKAQARAVAWRSAWSSLSACFRGITGEGLAAGMKVLVKVHVTYHELYGFSLQITDIDPSYTLGEAERQRLETIARLQSDGVWDMNREAGLPAVILRIAVVSSASAAGWRDFRQEISRYPYNLGITLFEAVMQGRATEDSIIAALENIADRADDFDAVVIIRGGGSASDLSAFDGYRLCCHIAQFPLPVITGIGHDKDRSVADMVAAVELKTPTAAAVWLGERLSSLATLLDNLDARISEAAAAILERERQRMERAARVVSIGAVEVTRRLETCLERLGADLARRCGEHFLREVHRLSNFSTAARERPVQFLTRTADRLAAAERTVTLRRPENILALGFAIVRLAKPKTEKEFLSRGGMAAGTTDGVVDFGKAIIDPSTLSPDQPLDITLAKGTMKAKKI